MGTNAAFKTAAGLLNALLDRKGKLRDRLGDLTPDGIEAIFERAQSAILERAGFTVSTSHDLQAFTAYKNPFLPLLLFEC